jgi:inositol-phosphate transport system permease protein
MSHNFKNWPIVVGLILATIPIMLMYLYLFVDTFTDTLPGEMIPNRFTLDHWRFLWENIEGKASVWLAMLNTLIFASSVTLIVLSVSSTSSYALSRLNLPFRRQFLVGVLLLHAFPSITLIIAIF